jgi:hypothetical protein
MFRQPKLVSILWKLFAIIVVVGISFTAFLSQVKASNFTFTPQLSWAGYVKSGSITDVTGQWTVPQISTDNPSSADTVTWVGVDGYPESNQYLLQAGTFQSIVDGSPIYEAFYEVISPGYLGEPVFPYQTNSSETVNPNDQMFVELKSSGTVWVITIKNMTKGWTDQTIQSYPSSASTAEWIIERPANRGTNPTQYSQLAKIDQPVTFQDLTVNGNSPQLNQDNGLLMQSEVSPYPILAIPSAPSANGDAFTVALGAIAPAPPGSTPSPTTPTPTSTQTPTCSASGDGVTLFIDANYGGSCHTFGVGDYSDLSQFGLDQNVSSLQDTNSSYHITFFDQTGLTGTPGYYDADAPQLTGYWNDRARSMRVERHAGDGVTLCTDASFGGNCHTFGVGEYSDLSQFGLDQNVSSLRDTNSAYHVTLFDQKGLTGTPGYYDADTSQLTGYWNDRARSMRVESHATDGVTLYVDGNYGGNTHTFGVGEYSDLSQFGLDQNVSSLRDANAAYHITLFDQKGLTGTPGYYDADTPQLTGYWNDRARSMRVEKHRPTSCNPGTDGIIAYIDTNYQAGCLFITGDIPDLTTFNFDQVISSLRFAGSYTNTEQIALYRQANYQDLCGTYSQDQPDLTSCSDQALSVKVLSYTPPVIPTPTPSPTASSSSTPTGGTELLSNPWSLSGNNGAAEQDEPIDANTLQGMQAVQVTFNLHGTSFGNGDDEASVVFVQNGDWRAANVIVNGGQNGLDGSQTLTIPLSAFHKVGDSSTVLDPMQPVSNLHARFWNTNAFTVDITSIQVLPTASTPTPTPTSGTTPTPTPTAAGVQPFTVYDETLAANWGDWSWCSNNNFADTAHPNTGTYDISWTVTCAYGGLALHQPGGFDTTGYTSLTFALGASQPGQTVQISLYDSSGNTGIPVQLDNYGGTPVAGQYTVYTIPLTAFQSTSTITGILIQDITGNATEPPMYVDTIIFQ